MDNSLKNIIADLTDSAKLKLVGNQREAFLPILIPYLEFRVSQVYNTAKTKNAKALAKRAGELFLNKYTSISSSRDIEEFKAKFLFDQMFTLNNEIRVLSLKYIQFKTEAEKEDLLKETNAIKDKFEKLKNQANSQSNALSLQYSQIFKDMEMDLNYILGKSSALSARFNKIAKHFPTKI